MAKTSLRVKQKRTPKYKTQAYTRCNRCGRPRAVYKKFKLCRICLRELAHQGAIPGMTRALVPWSRSRHGSEAAIQGKRFGSSPSRQLSRPEEQCSLTQSQTC